MCSQKELPVERKELNEGSCRLLIIPLFTVVSLCWSLLVSAPGSWHAVPEALEISRVMGVSFCSDEVALCGFLGSSWMRADHQIE